MDIFTAILNAAAAAGPVVLLALAILAFVWRFGPIVDKFANGMNQRMAENTLALQTARQEMVTTNRVNDANAQAIGGLAESISALTAAMQAGHEKLSANDEHMNTTQDSMSNAVTQLADATKSLNQAMEKSIEFEQKRQLSLVGGISQIVTSVGDMSRLLKEDIDALGELIKSRPEALDDEGLSWFRSHILDVHACVFRIETKLNALILPATNEGNSQPETAVSSTEEVQEVQP